MTTRRLHIAPPSPEHVGTESPNIMRDAHGAPLDNMPLTRIVIHTVESESAAGVRYAVAREFGTRCFKSSHYITDPGGTLQDVWDSHVAEAAPPNFHSIHIEQAGRASFSRAKWTTGDPLRVVRRTANLTARLALAYGVPLRRLTVAQVAGDARGYCGHVDVSAAFHQTDHTDPGPDYPWDVFAEQAHKHALYLQAAARRKAARHG